MAARKPAKQKPPGPVPRELARMVATECYLDGYATAVYDNRKDLHHGADALRKQATKHAGDRLRATVRAVEAMAAMKKPTRRRR